MSDIRSFIAECLQTLPENLSSVKQDIKDHFEQRLASELENHNIVTREQFDIQVKLLTRIEQRLSDLEANAKAEDK